MKIVQLCHRTFFSLGLLLMMAMALPVDAVGADSPIVISEIHYDPDVGAHFVEYVELFNRGTENVDLSGWFFCAGLTYTIPPGTQLAPGATLVVVENPGVFASGLWYPYLIARPQQILGPYEGRLDNEGERLILCDADGLEVDRVEYKSGFPWPVVGDPIPAGNHGLGSSIQLVNPAFDNNQASNWRSAFPSPGKPNLMVQRDNTPSDIRKVKHEPSQPRPGETVRITVKVDDPEGVLSVVLEYQVVLPGQYIAARGPRSISQINVSPDEMPVLRSQYLDNWESVAMLDDGGGVDVKAGDSVYSVELAPQEHRSLVRYRIVVTDGEGERIQVPYADDPSLNFAYFVYDGVPDYVGFSSEMLTTLPVYHLITDWKHLHQCLGWDNNMRLTQGSNAWFVYNWTGTFVYDGVVYDNIRYRLRGANGRYQGGNTKRSMRFRFNRGHYFQARDREGKKYPAKWRTLTTAKGFSNRRTLTFAFNEHVNFHLANQMGVPAPLSHYFHFRVIRGAEEAPDPWQGDFWGLGFAQETYDSRFVATHQLEKGNLYKLINSTRDALRQQRVQGPLAVTDGSDHDNIENRLTGTRDADYVRHHVNLDRWYRYHALVQLIRHYDYWPSANKNSTWYFEPDYRPENSFWGRLWILPYDTDSTWGPTYNKGHDVVYNSIFPASGGGSDSAATPELQPDYYNAVREARDLLWQTDQIEPFLDALAAPLVEFVRADLTRWLNGPSAAGNYSQLSGAGRSGLEAYVRDMKAFAFKGGSWPGGSVGSGGRAAFLDGLVDNADRAYLPATPTIVYTGEANYPVDALHFSSSSFSDPQGPHTFAGLMWRVAEVDPQVQPSQPGDPRNQISLVADHGMWRYFRGDSEPSSGTSQWRSVDFNDSFWAPARAPIGYGESFISTTLRDMRDNYSTLYARKEFSLESLTDIGELVAEVQFDDAFILWLNGQVVAYENVPSTELPYNTTVANREDNHSYIAYTLAQPIDYLQIGKNVLAVQVLNQSLTSSDLFFDMRLFARKSTPTDGTSQPNLTDVPPLEIKTVWTSGELNEANGAHTLPAGVLIPGRSYRVRCKMKDDTQRWSHWSAPVQFVAGEPLSPYVASDLRLTELMYHPADAPEGIPWDADDYEFVELRNVGNQTLSLRHLRFVDGIYFDFVQARITHLAPGAFVLIVADEDAFVSRYGEEARESIAGTYQGRLSNGGEQLKLIDFQRGTLFDFSYGDTWHPATDGDGYALEVQDPSGTTGDALGETGVWQPGSELHGTPGR